MVALSKLKEDMKASLEKPPASRKRSKRPPKVRRTGLPPEHARALSYFLNNFDADSGLKSVWGAMVAASQGVAGGFTDILPKMGQDFTPYRTLRRMSEVGERRNVSILYLYYGPTRINLDYSKFGEWAPLVRFTTKVDEVRQAMVDDKYKERYRQIEANLKDIGASEEAYDRCKLSVWNEVNRISESDAVQFALSSVHSLSYREDFVRTVIKQAKAVLNRAADSYMDNLCR